MASRALAGLALAGLSVAGHAAGQSNASAERVVSLVPAATETLFAIGAGDRVVGVTSFDHWPAEVESLPRVGALLDPDLETIITLRPDLVVLDPSHTALALRLVAAGIETFEYATAGVEDALAQMRRLGVAVGRATTAKAAAAALRGELDGLRGTGVGANAPTVMLVFGRRPGAFAEVWVNGGVGFLHELLELGGGRNLYADIDRPSFKAGMESLLARVPEIVIELRPDDQEAINTAQIVAEWHSVPGYAAVRVEVVTEDWVLLPGPRMAAAARLFASRIKR